MSDDLADVEVHFLHNLKEAFRGGCSGCGYCLPAPPPGIWWRALLYRWRLWWHRNDPFPAQPLPEGRL